MLVAKLNHFKNKKIDANITSRNTLLKELTKYFFNYYDAFLIIMLILS